MSVCVCACLCVSVCVPVLLCSSVCECACKCLSVRNVERKEICLFVCGNKNKILVGSQAFLPHCQKALKALA